MSSVVNHVLRMMGEMGTKISHGQTREEHKNRMVN